MRYLVVPFDKEKLLKLKTREIKDRPVGLMNLGNTCYLNSLLQALNNTVAFLVNLFLYDGESIEDKNAKKKKLKTKKEINIKQNITDDNIYEHKLFLKKVQNFYKKMITTKEEYISSEEILELLPDELSNHNQQDVTEVLRFLFEKLGGSEKEFLRLIFSGVVVQKVQCQTCFYVSKTKETLHDFSFPFSLNKSSENISIQTFFDTFVNPEKIDGHNKYKCSRCNKKRDALKWNEILSPPAHLILILNRCNWSFNSNENKKIKTHVKINHQIIVNEFTYKLYGAIIHGGVSATSGHYYYIGRRSEAVFKKRRRWYKVDDSTVTVVSSSLINEISEDETNDHTPYVIFYRCEQAPPSPLLRC